MKATESQKSKMRAYYQNNKDAIKERHRAYYLKHREELCSQNRNYRLSRGTSIRKRMNELHPLRDVHNAILSRCGIRSCSNKYILSAYAGRGISVCKEWIDLKTFESWCLSHGWKKGLQIDRIDNNKGYCPDNCRFVTAKENNRNRRSNHFVVYNGERKTVAEFVEIGKTVLGYDATLKRLNKGWSVKEAFEHHKCSNQYRRKSHAQQPKIHYRRGARGEVRGMV